jgi:hypothetical protein
MHRGSYGGRHHYDRGYGYYDYGCPYPYDPYNPYACTY